MSAASFRPGDALPPALLAGAAARCLLDELVARLLEPVAKEAEIERLPANAVAKDDEAGGLATSVLARLANASLFGARRVLVVLGGHELLRAAAIKAWIEKPSPRTHLLIAVVRAPKDGLPAIPAGLPVASVWDPGPQGPAETRRFLARRLHARGSTAAEAVFDALFEQAGSSLDALDAELEKLSLYRLAEPIRLEDVDALCGHTAGRDFDRLWQALCNARLGEALALFQTMSDEGLVMFGGGRVHGPSAVANALLPMLLARIRRVAAVAPDHEKLVGAVATALNMKPGYVHFLKQDARTLGRRLAGWQAAAIAAEAAQKRVGIASEAQILEQLFTRLARAA